MIACLMDVRENASSRQADRRESNARHGPMPTVRMSCAGTVSFAFGSLRRTLAEMETKPEKESGEGGISGNRREYCCLGS